MFVALYSAKTNESPLADLVLLAAGKVANEISKEHTLTISRLASACEESHRSGQQVAVEAVS